MHKLLAVTLLLPTLIPAQSDRPTELYYLVFLRRDPDRKAIPKAELERIQAAHMANIHAMADRGVLVAAGPFEDKPPVFSGLFVFKAASMEEARRIAEEDPTVAEHRNLVDVYPWLGPKGIGEEYKRLHKEHPDTPEDMGVHPFCMMYSASGSMDAKSQEQDDYIERLRKEGKLAMAGSTDGKSDVKAILVFNRIPDDEARHLAEDSPAVRAGQLRPECHRWWSAAHVLPK